MALVPAFMRGFGKVTRLGALRDQAGAVLGMAMKPWPILESPPRPWRIVLVSRYGLAIGNPLSPPPR